MAGRGAVVAVTIAAWWLIVNNSKAGEYRLFSSRAAALGFPSG